VADRPNLMITKGFPPIRRLIDRGINMNITLLLSIKVYENVVNAYRFGVVGRLADGEDRSASPAGKSPMPLHRALHQ
jgi:transaldolase/glucose-6-phosphate isomerase